MTEEKNEIQDDLQVPLRFSVAQRIEHFILSVSFTVLSLTGLVQKFAMNPFSEKLISLMGGIEPTRKIHRAAAIVFALLTVYHFIVLAYKYYVRRLEMTMLPYPGDFRDGLHSLGYSLFLRQEPSPMPRYNFAEKLEYWALIWGGLIMLATGFMLWNPLIATLFLPGQFIPAAKAAHGGEAVLAVLAIVVWHFYNVHIKMFNKSMFTGRMTRLQMEEEHGAEWSELSAGKANPAPLPAEMRRRRLIFIPVAAAFAALGSGGIYWAATAETTAISTLPVSESPAQIYSPASSSLRASTKPSIVSASRIPHPVAGQEKCFGCHGASGMKPIPSNHEGRPVDSCLICHKTGPLPKPGEKAAEQEETEQKAAAKSAGPRPAPHPTDKAPYTDCLNCHDIGKVKPFPADHAGRPVESCTACHR